MTIPGGGSLRARLCRRPVEELARVEPMPPIDRRLVPRIEGDREPRARVHGGSTIIAHLSGEDERHCPDGYPLPTCPPALVSRVDVRRAWGGNGTFPREINSGGEDPCSDPQPHQSMVGGEVNTPSPHSTMEGICSTLNRIDRSSPPFPRIIWLEPPCERPNLRHYASPCRSLKPMAAWIVMPATHLHPHLRPHPHLLSPWFGD